MQPLRDTSIAAPVFHDQLDFGHKICQWNTSCWFISSIYQWLSFLYKGIAIHIATHADNINDYGHVPYYMVADIYNWRLSICKVNFGCMIYSNL